MTKFSINAQALKAVSMAANKKDISRRVLMGVYITPNEIVAIDSYRMHRYVFYNRIDEVPEDGILIDASLFSKIKASQEFVSFEKIEDDKWIIDSQIANVIEGKYPDYKSILEERYGECDKFGVNPDYMTDAMKAVKIVHGKRNKIGNAVINVTSPLHPIRIKASHDEGFEAIIMPVRLG